MKENKEIYINIKLLKVEEILFGNKIGKVLKEGKVDDFEKLIYKLVNKVKFNIDLKIFDVVVVFDKIDENFEVYGFMSGCVVYYLGKN